MAAMTIQQMCTLSILSIGFFNIKLLVDIRTILCSVENTDWEWSCTIYWKWQRKPKQMFDVCTLLTLASTNQVFSNQFLSLGLANQRSLSLSKDRLSWNASSVDDLATLRSRLRTPPCSLTNHFQFFSAISPSFVLGESHRYMLWYLLNKKLTS